MIKYLLSLSLFLSQVFTLASDKPNFLIILTDDQSWVGTSLLMDPDNPDSKSDYYQTPHIDKLMQRGMRFTNGYSSGAWCVPSRRCIQSGQSTSRHIYNEAADQNEAAFAKIQSMPKILKSVNADYRCAHFGKWHLKYPSVTPETLGYDVSDGDTDNSHGEMAYQLGFKGEATPKDTPDVWEDPKMALDLSQRTGDFIEEQSKAGNPWMVQLSQYAVHLKISYLQSTYDALNDRPKGEKHAVQEFAAMTQDMDRAIGQLIDRLETIGALDNTYIIFLSDNGGRGAMPVVGKPESNSEQGRNYPLAGSKHSIYEGGLRVLFSISGPGIAEASINHTPIGGVDILPTVADLAGFEGKFNKQVDGGSFKGLAFGETEKVNRSVPFLVFHSKGGEAPRTAKQKKKGKQAFKA
ncbi:MAG: sulfatase-like hydrolase/transferase, partial [Verrucomicrobiota bacterium]